MARGDSRGHGEPSQTLAGPPRLQSGDRERSTTMIAQTLQWLAAEASMLARRWRWP
jgi:hypothetical protein